MATQWLVVWEIRWARYCLFFSVLTIYWVFILWAQAQVRKQTSYFNCKRKHMCCVGPHLVYLFNLVSILVSQEQEALLLFLLFFLLCCSSTQVLQQRVWGQHYLKHVFGFSKRLPVRELVGSKFTRFESQCVGLGYLKAAARHPPDMTGLLKFNGWNAFRAGYCSFKNE